MIAPKAIMIRRLVISSIFGPSSHRDHPDRGHVADAEIDQVVGEAFRRGVMECELDIFHISRSDRTKRQSG